MAGSRRGSSRCPRAGAYSPHIPSHSRRPPLHRTALTAEYAARLPQVPSSQRRRDTPTSSWGECSLHPYFARIPSHLVTQPTDTRRPALHRTAFTAEYAARLPQVPSSSPPLGHHKQRRLVPRLANLWNAVRRLHSWHPCPKIRPVWSFQSGTRRGCRVRRHVMSWESVQTVASGISTRRTGKSCSTCIPTSASRRTCAHATDCVLPHLPTACMCHCGGVGLSTL